MRNLVGYFPANGLMELAEDCHSQFSVGGVSVEIAGNCNSDVALSPALELFQSKKPCTDIHIHVAWASRLHLAEGVQLFDSGTTWQLYENDYGFQFDVFAPVFGPGPFKRLSIDTQFREAFLEKSEECLADFAYPVQSLGYPLDELLITHRLSQEKAIELHGTGIVGPNETSNLFVGHSEAGKSTTARLWDAHGDVKILSDDRIIVREDKVREDQSHQAGNQIFMYGTPWHGEAAFALPERAPLQRIFILEHGHGNVLTRLTKSQAVAELFARSFVPFHRHEYVESALSFLEDVADSVPCYRYAFEPDQRAVDRILQIND